MRERVYSLTDPRSLLLEEEEEEDRA